jgi:hypothetical protein
MGKLAVCDAGSAWWGRASDVCRRRARPHASSAPTPVPTDTTEGIGGGCAQSCRPGQTSSEGGQTAPARSHARGQRKGAVFARRDDGRRPSLAPLRASSAGRLPGAQIETAMRARQWPPPAALQQPASSPRGTRPPALPSRPRSAVTSACTAAPRVAVPPVAAGRCTSVDAPIGRSPAHAPRR